MSAKRTQIRDIPGLLAGRLGAGFLAGGGVLSASAMGMMADSMVVTGGITGIFLAGAGLITANTIQQVKQTTKALSYKELDGAQVELDTKDVAKVFFGLPAKQDRIYVNKGGMVAPPLNSLPNGIKNLIPGSSVFVSNLPEAQTFEEVNNYVVLKNGRVYIEKIITPTSLSVWDSAFEQAGGKVTWPQASPPRTVQDGLKNMISNIFKTQA
ncbi:MAG: hypothetical protein H9W81_02515 [Enterococcus sp.]|nr:hypothetical protein [Enterococcus sp.]